MPAKLHDTTSTLEHGIEVRPRIFDWQFDELPAVWAGDEGLTQFLNVFSALAPHTEGFAIGLAREVTGEMQRCGMKQEVGGFCGQEARHAEAHKRFNEQVILAQGFDCTKLDQSMTRFIDTIGRWPVQHQVASLCAGEHFIALVAHWYLNEAPREQIHEAGDRLFTWHCLEEIEHCAVAFDLYDRLYGTGFKAHLIKKQALLRVSRLLGPLLYRMWKDLMAQARQLPGREAAGGKDLNARAIRKLLGALTRQSAHYLDYYRPGFHPWSQNKKYLPQMPELIHRLG